MFEFFQSPVIITLIIMVYFLFFFILFLTKLPKTNGKHQISADTSGTSINATKEGSSECTMFGFLKNLPKDDPIPDECMSCQKLVGCLMEKRAFKWYIGQDSTQSE